MTAHTHTFRCSRCGTVTPTAGRSRKSTARVPEHAKLRFDTNVRISAESEREKRKRFRRNFLLVGASLLVIGLSPFALVYFPGSGLPILQVAGF